jgi:hypothetical protein
MAGLYVTRGDIVAMTVHLTRCVGFVTVQVHSDAILNSHTATMAEHTAKNVNEIYQFKPQSFYVPTGLTHLFKSVLRPTIGNDYFRKQN